MENELGLKVISYRGGLVTFRIPIHWVEEYEANGGGTFYENGPDTGTLRLHVLTLKAPPSITENVAFHALANLSDVEVSQIRLLLPNLVLAQNTRRSSENGYDITLKQWWLASAGEDGIVRVAYFTYTILTSQERDESILKEYSMVQREIENAKIYSGSIL